MISDKDVEPGAPIPNSDRLRLTAAVTRFRKTMFSIPDAFRRKKGAPLVSDYASDRVFDGTRTLSPDRVAALRDNYNREDRLTARDREVIAELQAGKVEQANTRIVRMKAKFSALKPGSRWDAQRGKWVDDSPGISRINPTRRAQGVLEPGRDSEGRRLPPRIPEGHTNYFD